MPQGTATPDLLPVAGPVALPVATPVATLGSYRGGAGRSVRRLKFGADRREVRALARGLAALVPGDPERPHGGPDLVTWVPTTSERRGRRGFDQAGVLARATARELRRRGSGVVVRRLLLRAPGPAQTGGSGSERRSGPVMRVRTAGLPDLARVVLVDDVVTTGATMTVASRLLLEAGASAVVPVAVARTPGPGPRTGRRR